MGHARKRLGAAVAPKEIDFVDSLPHTRSGKIMRRLLKARELGLPEGDTSTVETPGRRRDRSGFRPRTSHRHDPDPAYGGEVRRDVPAGKIRGFLHLTSARRRWRPAR